MNSFSLGDTPAKSVELLNLVIGGQKTATSWSATHGDQNTRVGEQMIITDWENNPKILIETTEIYKIPFNQVDQKFAYDEGVGDRSLIYWQQEHKRFFCSEGTFSEEMEIYCQRFKVIKIL